MPSETRRYHIILKPGQNSPDLVAEVISVGDIINLHDDWARIQSLGIITGDMHPYYLNDVKALQQVASVEEDSKKNIAVDVSNMDWDQFRDMMEQTTLNLKTMTEVQKHNRYQMGENPTF